MLNHMSGCVRRRFVGILIVFSYQKINFIDIYFAQMIIILNYYLPMPSHSSPSRAIQPDGWSKQPLRFGSCVATSKSLNMPDPLFTPFDPEAEHLTLIRWVGRLQHRMDQLISMAHSKIVAQEAQIIRLRGQLLLARTASLWGLTPRMDVVSAAIPITPQQSAVLLTHDDTLEAARQVVCQTGCVGHAHHWLDDSGHCQRDGRVCEHYQL
jgi:hypothetical protein